MPLNVGSTAISKLYLGSTPVDKLYLGTSQVWSNTVPVPGRMQVSGSYELPSTSTWHKVFNFVASSVYASTTTIANNSLVVPSTGTYTLTGGLIYSTGSGTQLSRVVKQDGTILVEDPSGNSPSVLASTVVSLIEGELLSIEGYATNGTGSRSTVSSNANSYVQIVPV